MFNTTAHNSYRPILSYIHLTLNMSCLVLVDTAQHPSVEINRAGFGVRMYAIDDYFVS